jgi:hypothetical protein
VSRVAWRVCFSLRAARRAAFIGIYIHFSFCLSKKIRVGFFFFVAFVSHTSRTFLCRFDAPYRAG